MMKHDAMRETTAPQNETDIRSSSRPSDHRHVSLTSVGLSRV